MGESKDYVNEVREDFIGRRVIISGSRSNRPAEFNEKNRPQKCVPPEKCFFCPGNERLTPPEIDRIERDGKWEVRCFPNKFPAFRRESKNAYGRHEIIVENPCHSKTLSELSESNLSNYLEMVKRRLISAKEDKRIKYACVFKNEGKTAGASLEHTHTQLAAMGFVPRFTALLGKKENEFRKYAAKHRKNAYYQNRDFFAFCPHASRFHFESWIAPKKQVSSLLGLGKPQMLNLARAMKSVLFATDMATGFAPYNIIFNSAPFGVNAFPFHLQVFPRISTWAGFELSTSEVMTSLVPEDSAKAFASILRKRKR